MASYSKLAINQVLVKLPSPLFTLTDFAKLFPARDKNTLYARLKRLKQVGLIKQLSQGKYLITDKSSTDFVIANFLYQPSYISLESALSFYGIITGFAYQITSLTPRKTKMVKTLNKEYYYHHIHPSLFWGYEKQEQFLIAQKEKAVLDFFYFSYKGLRQIDRNELELSSINKKRLLEYILLTKNKSFIKFIKNLKLL